MRCIMPHKTLYILSTVLFAILILAATPHQSLAQECAGNFVCPTICSNTAGNDTVGLVTGCGNNWAKAMGVEPYPPSLAHDLGAYHPGLDLAPIQNYSAYCYERDSAGQAIGVTTCPTGGNTCVLEDQCWINRPAGCSCDCGSASTAPACDIDSNNACIPDSPAGCTCGSAPGCTPCERGPVAFPEEMQVNAMTDSVIHHKAQHYNNSFAGLIVLKHQLDGQWCYQRYMHMNPDLLTSKGVGESVAKGEYLGKLALHLATKAGTMLVPHLHVDMCCGPHCPLEKNPEDWSGSQGGRGYTATEVSEDHDNFQHVDQLLDGKCNADVRLCTEVLNSADRSACLTAFDNREAFLGASNTNLICHTDYMPDLSAPECMTYVEPVRVFGSTEYNSSWLNVQAMVSGSLPQNGFGNVPPLMCFVRRNTIKMNIPPITTIDEDIQGKLYYYLSECYDPKIDGISLSERDAQIQRDLVTATTTLKNCTDGLYRSSESASGCVGELQAVESLQKERDKLHKLKDKCGFVLGASNDMYDELYKNNCIYNYPEPGNLPSENRKALLKCVNNHIKINKDKPLIKENNSLEGIDPYRMCQTLEIDEMGSNQNGRPPIERIYEYDNPWSPRHKVSGYAAECPQFVPNINPPHYPELKSTSGWYCAEDGQHMFDPSKAGDANTREVATPILETNAQDYYDCIVLEFNPAQCCMFLGTKPIEMDNFLEVRRLQEVYPELTGKWCGTPYTWEPLGEYSWPENNEEPDDDNEGFVFYDSKDSNGRMFEGAQPWVQYWDFGGPDCKGWNDAIVGVGAPKDNCAIGGWAELKLYQSRCYSLHNVRCICDYEKNFKIGSQEEYVLRRAGAMIQNITYKADIEPSPGKRLAGLERTSEMLWPLGWRGYISEKRENQRFPNLGGKVGAAMVSNFGPYEGMDNAKPGDIIIWDVDVDREYTGNYSPTFLPHVAYVVNAMTPAYCKDLKEAADRAKNILRPGAEAKAIDCENGPFYLHIAEMNFGKFPDTCGNTDRWGIETERWLYRQDSWGSVYNTLEGTIPDDLKEGGVGYTQFSCRDSNLARCREDMWQLAKVYRPSLDDRSAAAEGVPTTLPTLSKQERRTEAAIEEALLQRDMGLDPPPEWRREFFPKGVPVGSILMSNMAQTDRETEEEELSYAATAQNSSIGNNKQVFAGYNLNSARPGGSGTPPPVITPPSTTPAPGENCAADLAMNSWPRGDEPWTIAEIKNIASSPSRQVDWSYFATKNGRTYSITDIMLGPTGGGAWPDPNRMDHSRFPDDYKPLPPPVCDSPVPDVCIDAPACFVDITIPAGSPGYDCEKAGRVCDGVGWKRKLGDPNNYINTDTALDAKYRNSGYSRDLVVDYLYYANDFLNPSKSSVDQNPNMDWLEDMSRFEVIEWLRFMYGRFFWMHGTPSIDGRLIWKINGPGETWDTLNLHFKQRFTPWRAIAVTASDLFYRGLTGIVIAHNGAGEIGNWGTVDILTANIPYSPACGDRQDYDAHNCYQIYGSFGTPMIIKNVPMENVSMMWSIDR